MFKDSGCRALTLVGARRFRFRKFPIRRFGRELLNPTIGRTLVQTQTAASQIQQYIVGSHFKYS